MLSGSGHNSEQAAAEVLGYTQVSWENLSGIEPQPASLLKSWSELTHSERVAAVVLGYTGKVWDNESGSEQQPASFYKSWAELGSPLTIEIITGTPTIEIITSTPTTEIATSTPTTEIATSAPTTEATGHYVCWSVDKLYVVTSTQTTTYAVKCKQNMSAHTRMNSQKSFPKINSYSGLTLELFTFRNLKSLTMASKLSQHINLEQHRNAHHPKKEN